MFFRYAQLFKLLVVIIFLGAFISNTVYAENNSVYKVFIQDNVNVYIDMESVRFYEVEGQHAIEFTSFQEDMNKGKVKVMRIYAFPTLSSFRVLAFKNYDTSSGALLDYSTKPTSFTSYSATSPIQKCVNFIINNYGKYKERIL